MPTTCHSMTIAAAAYGCAQKLIASGVAVISRFISPYDSAAVSAATANVGWRTISASGRPRARRSSIVGAGTCTRDCTARATSAHAARSTNEPTNGVANKSLPHRVVSGPRKPPTMPPASTSEIAFARSAGAAISAAAKRYCSPIAL